MSLLTHGKNTLEEYEITNIGNYGFWILVDDREYFVDFEKYPEFKKATIEQILNLKRIGPGQFSWSSIDADIELEALENPEKFILKYE